MARQVEPPGGPYDPGKDESEEKRAEKTPQRDGGPIPGSMRERAACSHLQLWGGSGAFAERSVMLSDGAGVIACGAGYFARHREIRSRISAPHIQRRTSVVYPRYSSPNFAAMYASSLAITPYEMKTTVGMSIPRTHALFTKIPIPSSRSVNDR